MTLRRSTIAGVRNAARRVGVDLVRYPESHHLYSLSRLVRGLDPDLVLDVGANQGQYAGDLRSLGYDGPILSFEPVRSTYTQLVHRCADDPSWQALNLALGSETGSATINVAANEGASSSLLPMLDRHSAAAPEADYVRTESVQVRRLDDVLAERGAPQRAFLKVDTQGFERSVLDGAGELLGSALVGVQLELSLVPLYDGAPLYDEMLERLLSAGYRLAWVDPGFADPRTGELLQFDAAFVLRDGASSS